MRTQAIDPLYAWCDIVIAAQSVIVTLWDEVTTRKTGYQKTIEVLHKRMSERREAGVGGAS